MEDLEAILENQWVLAVRKRMGWTGGRVFYGTAKLGEPLFRMVDRQSHVSPPWRIRDMLVTVPIYEGANLGIFVVPPPPPSGEVCVWLWVDSDSE